MRRRYPRLRTSRKRLLQIESQLLSGEKSWLNIKKELPIWFVYLHLKRIIFLISTWGLGLEA